jgi:hypothetical protein
MADERRASNPKPSKQNMKKQFFVFRGENGKLAAEVTETAPLRLSVVSWTDSLEDAYHTDNEATANWFSPKLGAEKAGEYEVA